MVKASVQHNFLFRDLEDDAMLKVVERLREVRCDEGRVVCREGDKSRRTASNPVDSHADA